MPSLKRSTTRKVVRGGIDPSEKLVREAIVFLFEIKAQEYRKTHPEFLTPSVDEFFSYARQVSDALEKTRVSKKDGIRRKLPQKKQRVTQLEPFFSFIIQDSVSISDPCLTILRVLTILLYALMLYKIVDFYMMELNFTILLDPEFSLSFSPQIRWFCTNVVLVLNAVRDTVITSTFSHIDSISKTIHISNDRIRAHTALYIGKVSAAALKNISKSKTFYVPILISLAGIGYEKCNESLEALHRSEITNKRW